MIALVVRHVPWFVAVVVLIIVGFPKAVAQVMSMIYPRGDDRRHVLWADCCALPPIARYEWALGAIKLGLTEGLAVRRDASRAQNAARFDSRPQPDRIDWWIMYSGLGLVAGYTVSDAFLPADSSIRLILAATMLVICATLIVRRLNRRNV